METIRTKVRISAAVARLRTESEAETSRDRCEAIRKLAAEAACEMALVHGGEWKFQIDHDLRLIVVRPV